MGRLIALKRFLIGNIVVAGPIGLVYLVAGFFHLLTGLELIVFGASIWCLAVANGINTVYRGKAVAAIGERK